MKLIQTFFLTAIFTAAAFTTPAFAADDNHIYCSILPLSALDDNRYFYSAVFLSDYSNRYKTEKSFRKHVEKNYPGAKIKSDVLCFPATSPRAAERALNRDAELNESLIVNGNAVYDVIMTGWTPDDFSKQSLKDFNITINGDSGDLQICVRDHECEDGDKVRVSVDGSRIFNGEIDHDWDCDEMRVQAGRDYSVELFAINGTGHKGQCSHRDINTGEIRVKGANTKTQSWKHRGGAGSRAKIIVRAK